MKRYIFTIIMLGTAMSLLAQKEVRKSIRRGNSAFKEQRYTSAEEEYGRALEKNASSKEASFNMANTYYKQQGWNEAMDEYKHYLTLENEKPEQMSGAWSNMGNTFLKKKANEKYENASAGGPLPPGTALPNQQAQAQQQVDNLKMSMEAYKNALRLNPRDDETRENLAIVQKMLKDKEGEGGGDDQQDQEDKKDQQDQEQNKDKNDQKEDKKEDENQMSQENIQQILEAIEQDERETQERVNQAKADQRKQQSDRNKRQNKDW